MTSTLSDAPPQVTLPGGGLRKNLSSWQVLALSIGTMAPSMAININPQGAASLVGRAVPLTLAFATVAVLLLAYGFARLSQHFNHAGSVFGLVGATIGPRAGAVAGWLLVGAYLLFGVSAAITGGIFFNDLMVSFGVLSASSTLLTYVVAVVILLIGTALAVVPAKKASDLILLFEAITVALILVIAVVVFVRLSAGTAPQSQHVDFSVFVPTAGTNFSSLALGAVFGFLSFAGFESSAAFGEEASEPKKDIPKALIGTAVGGGVFFVVISAIEVMGFGTSKSQLAAFVGSGSLFGDLGAKYVAPWLGDVVTMGTTVSAIGGAIACLVASSRILYALARDASKNPIALGSTSAKWGTPVMAALTVGGGMIVATLLAALISSAPLVAYGYVGTIGVLLILLGYLLVTVGAIKLLFTGERTTPAVPRWEIVVPVLAMAALLYVLYRNVWGGSAWLAGIAAVWTLIAVGVAAFAPAMVKRIGQRLTKDESLGAGE